MEDTLIFVDNGFFKLVKKYFENQCKYKKKFFKTFRNICYNEKLNLKHLFFYTAPPYSSKIPLEKEILLLKNHNKLIRMLKSKKWISIREGRCQRLKIDGEYKYGQKGVDILIAMDLMGVKENYPNIKKIILIACDSDFVPIIKNIKSKNLEVILYTYFDRKRDSSFSRHNELLNSCSKWVKLKGEDFE